MNMTKYLSTGICTLLLAAGSCSAFSLTIKALDTADAACANLEGTWAGDASFHNGYHCSYQGTGNFKVSNSIPGGFSADLTNMKLIRGAATCPGMTSGSSLVGICTNGQIVIQNQYAYLTGSVIGNTLNISGNTFPPLRGNLSANLHKIS